MSGMICDGIAASEAIDSSGEILDVTGCDISDLEEGRGTINYEHRGDDAVGASANDIVGRIVFAKKIYSSEDCTDSRQLEYYQELKLPMIYIIYRLFDGSGHPGAVSLAAIIRDCKKNGEKNLVGLSIEGTTLEKEKGSNRLKRSIARRVAATLKPCNKSAFSNVISDPNADAVGKAEHSHPMLTRITDSTTALQSPVIENESIQKALEAGSYNVAPSGLVGGAALQVEDKSLKNRVKAAVRDWDKRTPFKKFLKHRLPEASDDFIDRFSDLVEDYTIKKAQRDLIKAAVTKKIIEKVQAKATPVKTPEPEEALTIRGATVPANPDGTQTAFDEKKGVLHTPRGSFPMYIPSRDKDVRDAGQTFHNIMQDPKISKFHDYAMENWSKVHQHLKAGTLPPEVIMHGVLFSQLSPNTPVPNQELMYSVHQDTILVTCENKSKKIKDFVPGDSIWAVDSQGGIIETDVVALHDHGTLDGFEVQFEDGYRIVCSKNHKFLTLNGMAPLWQIASDGLEVLCEPETEIGWMAESMRPNLQARDLLQGTSQVLFGVQGPSSQSQGGSWEEECFQSTHFIRSREAEEGSSSLARAEPRQGDGGIQSLENSESREVQISSDQSLTGDVDLARTKSREGSSSQYKVSCLRQEMERGEPRAVRQERESSRSLSQDQKRWLSMVKGGVLAPLQRNLDLERSSNQLSRQYRAETSGFCQPESQDLGGSGRIFPFFRIQEGDQSGQDSGSRSNAESGMLESSGCDSDSTFRGVFQDCRRNDEARMATMAYSDAPLASTGNLVLRKIVRIRAVGPTRMYDLEVSHSKHNFLLPNGIVTSNSHLVDAMKATGKDPRNKEGLNVLRHDWLKRDQPQQWPNHSREHFQRLEDQLRIKNDSKLTGRVAGDIGSFMLANNKFKNMEKYHTLHNSLVDLVGRHRHDARSGVEELMFHKKQASLWDAKRRRDIAKGKGDPGEYNAGPDVPGLAPKTARYTYGMLGGGNVVVPDTHFARYLFGLDRQKDTGSIDYIKSLLWNENNSHVLNGIDRYYAKHHDAVKHMQDHPTWGKHFEKPEDAVFPAFWKNWVGILPHEAARGMKTNGWNESTDHRPFWDAVGPYLRKTEDGVDANIALRTAKTHHEWIQKYGEMPALLMYYRFLVPQLLEANAKRQQAQAVTKFEALAIDIRKGVQGRTEQARKATPPPETVRFNDKTVKPGEAYTSDGKHPGGLYLIDHTPDHYVAVPKSKVYDFTPDDLVKLPRKGPSSGYRLLKPPEHLEAPSVVSHEVHGVPEYTRHQEVKDLIHGLDLAQVGEPGSMGVSKDVSFWGKNAQGKRVYIKGEDWNADYADSNEFGSAHREALYHNLAKDFYGLGQYVVPTGVVRNPRTDQPMTIVEHTPGEHFNSDGDGKHEAQLKALADNGELHKIALMNMINDNGDRHQWNWLLPDEGGIKLIDHGRSFVGKSYVARYPEYLERHSEHSWQTPLHPAAAKWLQGLKADELDQQMRRHGVPEKIIDETRRRLKAVQLHARKPTSLDDALESPFRIG